jgi:hypothetical protein
MEAAACYGKGLLLMVSLWVMLCTCPWLAFYNGTPYVAYGDITNGYKATVMMYK